MKKQILSLLSIFTILLIAVACGGNESDVNVDEMTAQLEEKGFSVSATEYGDCDEEEDDYCVAIIIDDSVRRIYLAVNENQVLFINFVDRDGELSDATVYRDAPLTSNGAELLPYFEAVLEELD